MQTARQVREMMAGPSSAQGSVEAFLTLVYRALGSPAPLKDKARSSRCLHNPPLHT
jgi:hypothetical protein